VVLRLVSSGYGRGAAELEAPKGIGKSGSGGREAAAAGFDEAELEAADEDVGGVGYLKRSEGFGLCGLNILKGSTVGLSQSSEVGPGLLMKSSSSGTSRDRVAILTVPMVAGQPPGVASGVRGGRARTLHSSKALQTSSPKWFQVSGDDGFSVRVSTAWLLPGWSGCAG